MRLKTVKYYKVPVKFLIEDEEQELILHVNCLTLRKMTAYADKMENTDLSFDEQIKCNDSVIVGWENLEDEEGNPLEFDRKLLKKMQEDYVGFSDAIVLSIGQTYGDLRRKNSQPLVKS